VDGAIKPVVDKGALQTVSPIAASKTFEQRLDYWSQDVGPRPIGAKTDANVHFPFFFKWIH